MLCSKVLLLLFLCLGMARYGEVPTLDDDDDEEEEEEGDNAEILRFLREGGSQGFFLWARMLLIPTTVWISIPRSLICVCQISMSCLRQSTFLNHRPSPLLLLLRKRAPLVKKTKTKKKKTQILTKDMPIATTTRAVVANPMCFSQSLKSLRYL